MSEIKEYIKITNDEDELINLCGNFDDCHLKRINQLIDKYGANVFSQNFTCLKMAFAVLDGKRLVKAIYFLVSRGADVNYSNCRGFTLLMYAASVFRIEQIEGFCVLLSSGVDISPKNDCKENAVDVLNKHLTVDRRDKFSAFKKDFMRACLQQLILDTRLLFAEKIELVNKIIKSQEKTSRIDGSTVISEFFKCKDLRKKHYEKTLSTTHHNEFGIREELIAAKTVPVSSSVESPPLPSAPPAAAASASASASAPPKPMSILDIIREEIRREVVVEIKAQMEEEYRKQKIALEEIYRKRMDEIALLERRYGPARPVEHEEVDVICI